MEAIEPRTDELLTIGYSEGGFSNTVVTPRAKTWDELIQKFKTPAIGIKDGEYFTRCAFNDNYRNDTNALTGYLVILDGDSTLFTDTGEIKSGAPNPLLVHEVLQGLDITHCIYSSHSNAEKGNRYRVLINVSVKDKPELCAVVDWLIYKLHSENVLLNPVKENYTFSQCWYLPRVPDEAHAKQFVFYEHDGGEAFPKQEALAWYAKQQAQTIAPDVPTDTVKANPDSSIGKFNAEHGLKWIMQTLTDKGYQFKFATKDGAHNVYRFLSPTSETQVAGVVVLPPANKRGWTVFSHHGEHDPLCNSEGHAHDAFSLYALFEFGGNQDAAIKSLAPVIVNNPSAPDGILLLPSEGTTITESAQSIFSKIAPTNTMFMRGTGLVELKKTNELGLLGADEFRSRIENYGQLYAYRRHQGELCLVPRNCPKDSATAIMQTLKAAELLPSVRSISSSPVICEDNGKIKVLNHGYHAINGGVFVTGRKSVPDVPLDEAITAINNLHRDFHFQSPADKSRAFAMLITPAMKMGRFFSQPTPIDVAEANESQSGKTERQRTCRRVYGEKANIITARQGGVGSLDESFGQAIARGTAFIELDNFRGKLDSPFIESAITNTEAVSIRLPRQGEFQIDISSTTLQLSSNGVEVTTDFANRACITKILKQPNGYQWHAWHEGSLKQHITANQPYYLGCVFAVIKEWHQQGKPRTSSTGHDMYEWLGILDSIITGIFKLPSLMTGHKQTQEQVSNPNLVWLRAVCLAAKKSDDLNRALQAYQLASLCEDYAIDYPRNKTFYDDAQAARYVGTIMGGIFKQAKKSTVAVDGFEISRNIETVYNEQFRTSDDTKKYVIKELNP